MKAQRPAVSPFIGTKRNTSLYLSYICLYELSNTIYEDEGQRSNASTTFSVAVIELETPTVADRNGETNATQSLLLSVNAVNIVTCVSCVDALSPAPPPLPPRIRLTSIDSTSSKLSYPICSSPAVTA